MTNPAYTSTHLGRNIALIAVFAAFIAVCALLPAFPVGPAGVPITFQTLGVYLTALVLGGNRGGLATLLYLLVGLIGLPVFAGGSGGPAVLAAPSAGYLLGFPCAAWVTGTLGYMLLSRSNKTPVRILLQIFSVLMGSLIITVAGIIGMMVNAELSLTTALAAATLYLPGDIIKCLIAVFVALAVHRAFPALARGK